MAAPSGGASLSRKKIPTPEEEAENGTYRLPSGQLYIGTLAFRSALLYASKGKRVGKMAAKGIIAGAVMPEGEVCPLVHPETGEAIHKYQVFTCRAVVMQKGIMRSRPRIEPWACTLALQVDIDTIDPDVILSLLQEAGVRAGVGDFRPERGGIYGRFGAALL
jgi:hypothetical protein